METKVKVIEVISNVPAYFSRFSGRKKDSKKIRFTPAYRGPAKWMGYYQYQGSIISVKLCNNRNCLYCQNGLKDDEIRFGVNYLVDLDCMDSGEPIVINGEETTRKYFVAHNLREVAKQIEAEKAEKDEAGYPILPSLDDIEVPKFPTTGFRIVALGSVGKVGASCYGYINEKGEILVVDCGIDIGDIGDYDGTDSDEILNEEKRLPNFEWIENNRHRIKGIIITHGHLDHWGGAPYLPRTVHLPIYATQLVAELIKKQCRFLRRNEPEIRIFKPGEVLQFGETTVKTFSVNHSIPQACGLVITANGKNVCHLSDFRLNGVRSDDRLTMFDNLREIAKNQVDLLAMDVVNVREPGFSFEEEKVISELRGIICQTPKEARIVISFFGTNIARMKGIIEIAKETKRRLRFLGRAICDIYEIARNLEIIDKAPEEEGEGKGEIYCVTGCQAEPGSILERLSRKGEVENLNLKNTDIVIISSRPIPGSRKRLKVFENMVIGLAKFAGIVFIDKKGELEAFKGLNIKVNESLHTSGHASQLDLLSTIHILMPRQILPIHSDYLAMERFQKEVIERHFPSIIYRNMPPNLPIIKVES